MATVSGRKEYILIWLRPTKHKFREGQSGYKLGYKWVKLWISMVMSPIHCSCENHPTSLVSRSFKHHTLNSRKLGFMSCAGQNVEKIQGVSTMAQWVKDTYPKRAVLTFDLKAQSGSKDLNNRASGPKYYHINGIWTLKPYYLGPWTLLGSRLS